MYKTNTGNMRWARQRGLKVHQSLLFQRSGSTKINMNECDYGCPYESKTFMGLDLDQLAGGAYVLSSYKFKVQFKATL